MPGMRIDLTIDDKITPELQAKARRLQSFREPLVQAQALMLRSVDQNFRSDGRPKWPPLAPSTVAQRRKGSSRPLQDTGRLRVSVTAQDGTGAVRTVNDSVAIIGTTVKYARLMQEGGTINVPALTPKRAKALRWIGGGGAVHFARRTKAHTVSIPARPFLLFQAEDERRIVTIFRRYIEGA
ncbi:MAG TPA: phage virion morphogenesis protein [Limnochordia bacterium]|nr:phage virion morphogenesis protein [Limnochordia bacterium]